jgi:hypothetical protein
VQLYNADQESKRKQEQGGVAHVREARDGALGGKR